MTDKNKVLDKFNKVEEIIAGTIKNITKGLVTPPVRYSKTESCMTS